MSQSGPSILAQRDPRAGQVGLPAKWNNSKFALPITLAGASLLMYFPVLTATTYALHNDYNLSFLDNGPAGEFLVDGVTRSSAQSGSFGDVWLTGHTEAAWLVVVGRPLGALLLSLQYAFIHGFAELMVSRILSYVILLVAVYLLVKPLERLNKISAALLGILALGAPALWTYISWATNLVPGAIASLLAVGGVSLLASRRRVVVRGTAATMMFAAATLIYPPSLGLAVMAALLRILPEALDGFSYRHLLHEVYPVLIAGVAGVSSALSIVWLSTRLLLEDANSEFGSAVQLQMAQMPESYEFAPIAPSDVPGRLALIINIASDALLVGWPPPEAYLRSLILLAVLGWIFLVTMVRPEWRRVGILLALSVLLAVTPLILPATLESDALGNRNTLVPWLAGSMLLWLAITAIPIAKMRLSLVAVVSVMAIIAANQAISRAVYVQSLEYDAVKNAISAAPDTGVLAIEYVVEPPPRELRWTPYPTDRAYQVQNEIFDKLAIPKMNIVSFALADLNRVQDFRIVQSDDPLSADESRVVVRDIWPGVPRVTASASSTYGAGGLLEGRQPGWHVAAPFEFPYTLKVDLGDSRVVTVIKLTPQDGYPERMPGTVKVESLGLDGKWDSTAWVVCKNANVEPALSLGNATSSRFWRFEIVDNCGDPDLLTLKRIDFE